MFRTIRLHTAVHLKFLARNRVFHGFSLLVVLGLALGAMPALVYSDSSSRFVTLRGLAGQLHGAAGFITAGIGLFVLWSHRRARAIKMIATTPAPFEGWVASVFTTAALVGVVVHAVIATLVLLLSFQWNVPYQAGFLYVAIDRFAGSLILLAFVTALGAWMHPLVALLLIALLGESTFLTLRMMLEGADAGPLLTVIKATVSALYYVVPTFDPFAGRTLGLTRSMRVSISDWRYLGVTIAYALLAASFGYVATLVILRRRPLA